MDIVNKWVIQNTIYNSSWYSYLPHSYYFHEPEDEVDATRDSEVFGVITFSLFSFSHKIKYCNTRFLLKVLLIHEKIPGMYQNVIYVSILV